MIKRQEQPGIDIQTWLRQSHASVSVLATRTAQALQCFWVCRPVQWQCNSFGALPKPAGHTSLGRRPLDISCLYRKLTLFIKSGVNSCPKVCFRFCQCVLSQASRARSGTRLPLSMSIHTPAAGHAESMYHTSYTGARSISALQDRIHHVRDYLDGTPRVHRPDQARQRRRRAKLMLVGEVRCACRRMFLKVTGGR